MYVYIYDGIVNKRKNRKTLIKIEKKITDLGLNGKIVRLEGIKDTESIIKNEVRYQAKTIVAVGNDSTLNTVINAVLKQNLTASSRELPVIALIPLEASNNLISASLGIQSPEAGCEALLSRRLKNINIAQANQEYFLTQAEILGNYTKIQIEKDYSIEIKRGGEINIINLPLKKEWGDFLKIESGKKILKLLIRPPKTTRASLISESIFSLNKLTVTKETKKIIIDNCKEIAAPATIKTTDKFLNLIVGKNRYF